MSSAIFVTSGIRDPDIITSISKNESNSFTFGVNDPSVGGIEETMLKVDGWEASLEFLLILGLDSENSEEVTICGSHSVFLEGVSLVLDVFWERCGCQMGVAAVVIEG